MRQRPTLVGREAPGRMRQPGPSGPDVGRVETTRPMSETFWLQPLAPCQKPSGAYGPCQPTRELAGWDGWEAPKEPHGHNRGLASLPCSPVSLQPLAPCQKPFGYNHSPRVRNRPGPAAPASQPASSLAGLVGRLRRSRTVIIEGSPASPAGRAGRRCERRTVVTEGAARSMSETVRGLRPLPANPASTLLGRGWRGPSGPSGCNKAFIGGCMRRSGWTGRATNGPLRSS